MERFGYLTRYIRVDNKYADEHRDASGQVVPVSMAVSPEEMAALRWRPLDELGYGGWELSSVRWLDGTGVGIGLFKRCKTRA